MPAEYLILKDAPSPIASCPKCGEKPFRPFMRGQVQRWPFRWLFWGRRAYCALICWKCKDIVGYE